MARAQNVARRFIVVPPAGNSYRFGRLTSLPRHATRVPPCGLGNGGVNAGNGRAPRHDVCRASPAAKSPTAPEAPMSDTTATKVDSAYSPRGAQGQKYLASSVHVGMRLWEDEPPGDEKPASRRNYETVGYVLRGRAELRVEGQLLLLGPGDS